MNPRDNTPKGLTRVLLVSDHKLVRHGLHLVLENEVGFEVVGVADVVEEVPDDAKFDIALVRDRNGATAIQRLRGTHPGAGIVVLSNAADVAAVTAAFEAGASGYILEQAEPAEFLEGLRRVARGERYLEPSLGAALALRACPSSEERGTPALTPRERDVLRLIAAGHTNAEIAAQLCIAVRTVETHRSNLQTKLGVRSRAELVAHAARIGLLGV